MGFQNAESIANHMNQSDALILPSFFEGQPVVVLEAIACGLPVIVSSVGALPDLIIPEFGIVLDDISPNTISEAMSLFIENKITFDKKKMTEFANNHLSLSVVGKKFDDFYSKFD
jgi:glycosyltransferase involved in cell wall biosynthesis